MNVPERLAALRRRMQAEGLAAWIAPSADPHQSEYVAAHWQARAWLSGFSGSAGTLVVTLDRAGLWTDPRYHLRAADELAGSGIELFRQGLPEVPPYAEWLAQELPPGAVIGLDGWVVSAALVAGLEKDLEGLTLAVGRDLVGGIWLDRPPLPADPIFLHPVELAGETRREKIGRIRAGLVWQGAQACLLTALDDIAWSLNLRGSDVDYNPVAVGYALVTLDEVRLFIDPQKVPPDVRAALEADGVALAGYAAVAEAWRGVPTGAAVLIDPERTAYRLKEIFARKCTVIARPSIPRRLKAVKNVTELAGIRQAHIRDGAAVVKWLCWLDGELGWAPHTEVTLAAKLAEFRARGEFYRGPSFETSAGYRANAAVGHYRPRPETTPAVQPEGLLLVDSGGQYLDGTTDITRTISLGAPAEEEERRVFTQVLKSLIRLSRARFPRGTTGSQLDALARGVLWEEGWECRHGIGHGVGFFLNVHEGPPGLSTRSRVPFEPGFVVTVEPGVYFAGRFGVRIENVMVVTPAESTGFGDFCAFETVTLCPIDLKLVEVERLTSEEKAWLNAYHNRVYAALAPLLTPAEREWLRNGTRPV